MCVCVCVCVCVCRINSHLIITILLRYKIISEIEIVTNKVTNEFQSLKFT